MTRFGDRYGFYQIGDVKTYSKYELMDIHHDKPQAWQWNYNDEFFSRYDWTQEPCETIDELYKGRAEQLRRDYDYLILYFSGGYDSSNMLNAFLDNNIHVDEICIFYSRYDIVSLQHKELKTITRPYLKKLKLLHENIIFREIDYADYFFKWYEKIKAYKFYNEPIYLYGSMLSPNRLVLDLLFQEIDDWKNLLRNKKKIAWLHGIDKPMLRYFYNQWIFNFHDAQITCATTPLRQLIDDGTIGTNEFFYNSPQNECAKILIKQCHLLKNLYYKQSQEDFSKVEGANTFKEGYGWTINRMSLPFINTIYPKTFKQERKYFTEKNTSSLYWGGRDHWYYNTDYPGSQEHWKMYNSTLKEDKKHWKKWYNDNKTIDNGIKNCISKNYFI